MATLLLELLEKDPDRVRAKFPTSLDWPFRFGILSPRILEEEWHDNLQKRPGEETSEYK